MCQCYQIGGPFIAEDPDCSEHGREAQRAGTHRELIIQQCQHAVSALEYLQSL